MPVTEIQRGAEIKLSQRNRQNANTIRVDSDTDTLKFGTGASGTTEKEVDDLSSNQTITGVKTFTAAPVFAVAPSVTGDGGVNYVEIAISNAEIKALRATPKTLVAAPAANKIVVPISAIIELIAGANVLTETAANLVMKYNDGSGTAISEVVECTGFIDQAVDTFTTARLKQDGIVAKSAGAAKALVLHNNGAGEYGGNVAADALLKVKLFYSIVSMP